MPVKAVVPAPPKGKAVVPAPKPASGKTMVPVAAKPAGAAKLHAPSAQPASTHPSVGAVHPAVAAPFHDATNPRVARLIERLLRLPQTEGTPADIFKRVEYAFADWRIAEEKRMLSEVINVVPVDAIVDPGYAPESDEEIREWNRAFELAKQMCGGQVASAHPQFWGMVVKTDRDTAHHFAARLQMMRYLAVCGLKLQGQASAIPDGWPHTLPEAWSRITGSADCAASP